MLYTLYCAVHRNGQRLSERNESLQNIRTCVCVCIIIQMTGTPFFDLYILLLRMDAAVSEATIYGVIKSFIGLLIVHKRSFLYFPTDLPCIFYAERNTTNVSAARHSPITFYIIILRPVVHPLTNIIYYYVLTAYKQFQGMILLMVPK